MSLDSPESSTSSSEEDSNQDILNGILEAIRHSSTEVDFPNYFNELHALGYEGEDIELTEKFIESVLRRIRIPHIHEDKTTSENYFEHIVQKAQELAKEQGIEVKLYVGGGVVQNLLGNMYKHIHKRKQHQQRVARKPNIISQTLSDQVGDLSKIKHQSEVRNQMRLKEQMSLSTELHLKQFILGEQEPLLGIFMMGVGSDLDIYYEVVPKNKDLTENEMKAGKYFSIALTDHINKLKEKLELRKDSGRFKHTFLPNADVKEYNEQINRTLSQGGSLLDTIAFQFETTTRKKKQTRFRLPAGYPNILKDFMRGYFEYIAPLSPEFQGKISHKQAIRGLRALLEIPFLDIRDKKVIIQELSQILQEVKINKKLDQKAIEQFNKMVRNAQFQLAKNRPYSAKEGEPLYIALKIADEIQDPENIRIKFLLPTFLQKKPFDNRSEAEINSAVENYNIVKEHIISRDDFVQRYTDNGVLYHGTNAESGLCVLRGGFIVSTNKQGLAFTGPGVYTTPLRTLAEDYATNGMVIPLRLQQGNMKICNWGSIDIKSRRKLEEEAKKTGYEHVFDLLSDRNKYGFDIIISTHVLIHNQGVIEINKSLNIILEFTANYLLSVINENKRTGIEIGKALSNYLKVYEIAKMAGVEPIDFLSIAGQSISQIFNMIETRTLENFKRGLELRVSFSFVFFSIDALRELFSVQDDLYKIINRLGVNVSRSPLYQKYVEEFKKILIDKRGGSSIIMQPDDEPNDFMNINKTYDKLKSIGEESVFETELYDSVLASYQVIDLDVITSLISSPILSNKRMVEFIINHKEDFPKTISMWENEFDRVVAQSSNVEAFTELLNRVANRKEFDIVQLFKQALLLGKPEFANVILNKSPDISRKIFIDLNALEYVFDPSVSINPSLELVESLLKYNPEAVLHVIEKGASSGHNPLTFSILYKKPFELQAAVFNANPDCAFHQLNRRPGGNALTLAINSNNTQLVELFLDKRPKLAESVIEYGIVKGHNALTLAIEYSYIELAKLIIEKSPNTLNTVIKCHDQNISPLQMAEKNGAHDLVKFIREIQSKNIEKDNLLNARKMPITPNKDAQGSLTNSEDFHKDEISTKDKSSIKEKKPKGDL